MTQALAKSPMTSKPEPITTTKRPVLVEASALLDRMKEVYEAISLRAYDLFQERECAHGHDVEDWLRAESELLCPVAVEMKKSADQLILRVEMPKFKAEEIEVGVESYRVFISGRKEQVLEDKEQVTVGLEKQSEEVFRIIDLPAEVDSSRGTATLKGQTLEVLLSKVSAGG